MPSTIKEIPGFQQVAAGNNIVANPATNPTTYTISNINPYPNGNLIVGNSYSISDTSGNYNAGIAVELTAAPGAGMQTATFQRQS